MSWEQAWATAAVLVVIGAVLATAPNRRLRWVGAFAREAAVIGFLFGLWQLANKISVGGRSRRLRAGRVDPAVRADVHLPSEASVQQLVLGHQP